METAFVSAQDYIETLLGVSAVEVTREKAAWQTCIRAKLLNAYAEGILEEKVTAKVMKLPARCIGMISDDFSVSFALACANGAFYLFGPYLPALPDEDWVRRTLEHKKISASMLAPMMLYVQSLPVCAHSALISALQIFLRHACGEREDAPILELRGCASAAAAAPDAQPEDEEQELRMRQLEKRYELENRILLEVEHGNAEPAERLYRRLQTEVSRLKRVSDPLRNQKNLGFILNTLLRKSVERAHVHPIYIDMASSNFAHFIEHTNTVAQLFEMEVEMIRTYARLVRRHALREYSPIVRKAIDYISIHLASELRLGSVAQAAGVSPNYLSALFAQETGRTLSAFVNEKRVEKLSELLTTTDSSVQELAFYVGFSDLNYCTRIFKRTKGMTPGEYRRQAVK